MNKYRYYRTDEKRMEIFKNRIMLYFDWTGIIKQQNKVTYEQDLEGTGAKLP